MNSYSLFRGFLGGLILLGWTAGAGAQTAVKGGVADADSSSFYKALHALGDALGRPAMENVVEATGRGGVPQPTVWKIVLREGAGSREVEVTGGKITAQRPSSSPVSGSAIKLAELNLDSSGAFDATDVQARKVKLRYDSLNYLLRLGPSSGKPVWTIDLLNQGGEKIGTIRLAASDGTTISTDGRLANNPPPPSTTTVNRPPPTPTPRSAVVSKETPRPTIAVARETPRPARRPVFTETRERTTSTYTTTTSTRGRPAATPTPPPVATTTTTTTPQDIPVATISDREEDGQTVTTTSREESGGLFTRTGRTLDRTSQTVGSGFREAGSRVQRFFTFRRSSGGNDNGPGAREDRDDREGRDGRVENPRD